MTSTGNTGRCGRAWLVTSLVILADVAVGAPAIDVIMGPGPCSPRVRALSLDGSTVVGDLCGAWQWTENFGFQNLPGNCSTATRASASGAVVAGECFFPGLGNRAVRWVGGGPPQSMGTLAGYDTTRPFGLSDTGAVAAGQLFNTDPAATLAFYWSSAGGGSMQALPGQAPAPASGFALAMSGDGVSIFGCTEPPGFFWTPTRWRIGQPTLVMGMPPGLTVAYPSEANADGSVVVGRGAQGSEPAWRWVEGSGYVTLDAPPGWTSSYAADLTNDGGAVVGSYSAGGTSRAAYWTQSAGWRDLNTHLPSVGVDLTGWELTSCEGVSDYGYVLAGNGLYNGVPAAWRVSGIPSICSPRVQNQPVNTTVCSFGTTSLSVFAIPPTSPGAVSHQWFRYYPVPPLGFNVPVNDGPTGFGAVISGSNTGTLFFSNISLADAGYYWCSVAGGCAANESATVLLTVLPDISGNGGGVDTADLTLLLGNFGMNVPPLTGGDINGDGIVNTIDLTLLLGVFGQPCP